MDSPGGVDLVERERYLAAVQAGDFDTAAILAGEVIDIVDKVESAGAIVEGMGRGAEDWLREAPRLTDRSRLSDEPPTAEHAR